VVAKTALRELVRRPPRKSDQSDHECIRIVVVLARL
jgi:hypothetical protein